MSEPRYAFMLWDKGRKEPASTVSSRQPGLTNHDTSTLLAMRHAALEVVSRCEEEIDIRVDRIKERKT